VGLLLALATVTAAPIDGLAIVAMVLAVLSLLMQIQFYVAQEAARLTAQLRDVQSRAEIAKGLEAIPERVATLLDLVQREATTQRRANISAESTVAPDGPRSSRQGSEQ
jgi:hypothetical protein